MAGRRPEQASAFANRQGKVALLLDKEPLAVAPPSEPASPVAAESPTPAAEPAAKEPKPRRATQELQASELYLNRELSWLEFNRRVLHQARDERVPLSGAGHASPPSSAPTSTNSS